MFIKTIFFLFSVVWSPVVWCQVRPPNLSPDNLPDTAFTCEDKVTGGYYADVEADCQLFHVCVQVSEYEVSTNIPTLSLHIIPSDVLLELCCKYQPVTMTIHPYSFPNLGETLFWHFRPPNNVIITSPVSRNGSDDCNLNLGITWWLDNT